MIAATAGLRGTVAGGAAAATLFGAVANPEASAPATLHGTVSRAAIEAVDAVSTSVGVRVKIAGQWVPAHELAGPVAWNESADSHRRSVTLSLAGARWSIFRTLATWTLTPIEIWTVQGQPPAPLGELEFRGWIRSGSRQQGVGEPVVELECDDVAPYDGAELCYELAPFGGLTRGEIADVLAAGGGIAATDTPAGAVYDRPLFTDGRRMFEMLADLGAPEGWSWRMLPTTPGPTLQAYVPQLKQPPQPPDWVWHASGADPGGIQYEAPRDPSTRWVVQGLGSVYADESGLERELIRTQVIAPYAPKIAVQRQETSGTITDLSPSFPPVSDRIVSVIEVENQRRAGVDVLQLTREWGFYNPAAAKYRTPGTIEGPGPVGIGYHYTLAFIDQDGAYTSWPIERFVQLGERRLKWFHGPDLRVDRQRAEEHRWHRRRRAVRSGLSATPDVIEAYIGDDDVSYQRFTAQAGDMRPIETFGLDLEHETVFTYDEETGASTAETLQTVQWYVLGASVDSASHFVNHDGRGQLHDSTNRQLVGTRTVSHLLTQDRRILGSVEIESGYDASPAPEGPHDWGSFTSFLDIEQFRPVSRRQIVYNRRADGTVEEVTFPSDGVPTSRIIAGRQPLPRFLESPWTTLRSRPIEHVLDDEALAELFGFRLETLSLDHLLSLEEAQALALRLRRRATAVRATWRRAETRARVGDTVLLIDPPHGVAHRALLVDRQVTRDPIRGSATATYSLEVYLL